MNAHPYSAHRRPLSLALGLVAFAAGIGLAGRAQAAPPANDNRATPTVISGAAGRLVATSVDATKEGGEPNHAGNAGGKSVWFQWTGPAGNLRVDTVGSEFDTLLAFYQTNAAGALVLVASNDDALDLFFSVSGGYHQSRVSVTTVATTTYFIAVDGFNAGSGAQSGPLVLTWNQTTGAPANNAFSAATAVSGTIGGYGGRNQNATKETGEPVVAGNAGGRSIWYSWTAPVSGEAVVDTMGGSVDTLLGVFTGASVSGLTLIADNDDAGPVIPFSRVTFNAVGGVTYRISVDGYAAGTGSTVMHYSLYGAAPANDAFASAVVLAGSKGSIEGRNHMATAEGGEPLKAGSEGGRSVWYSWTPSQNGQATFDLFGLQWDTLIGIYTGAGLGALTTVAEGDDSLPGGCLNSRASFFATAGTTYYVAVDGFSSIDDGVPADYGSFSLNWEQAVSAPANDLFANALVLPGNTGSVTTSNTTAVYEAGEPIHGIITNVIFGLAGKSLWFSWTPSQSRTATVDTVGSTFDTFLAVYTGPSIGSLARLVSSDDIANSSGTITSIASRVVFLAAAGTTYYFAVDGQNNGTGRGSDNGTVVLNYSVPGGIPSNDAFTNATLISGESGQINGTTLDATVEVNEPEHAGISPASSVWYRWTAPLNGWFTMDTLLNAGSDTVLAIYTGPSVDALAEVTSNDDAVPSSVTQSRASFLATQGTQYYIVVDSKPATQGAFILRWRPTVKLTAVREPGNTLTLIITAAAPGFYEIQESTVLPTWTTFDSVPFVDPAGGTLSYDAGSIASPAARFFRIRQ